MSAAALVHHLCDSTQLQLLQVAVEVVARQIVLEGNINITIKVSKAIITITIATIISLRHLLLHHRRELSTRYTLLTLSLISSPSKLTPVNRALSTPLLLPPLAPPPQAQTPPLSHRHLCLCRRLLYCQVLLPLQKAVTVSSAQWNLTLTLTLTLTPTPTPLPILVLLPLFLLLHILQLSTSNLMLH